MNQSPTKHSPALLEFEDKRKLVGILNHFTLMAPQFKFFQHFLFHFSHFQYITILMSLELTVVSPTFRNGKTSDFQKFVQVFVLKDIFQDNYTQWIYSIFLICSWSYLSIFLIIFGLLGIKSLTKVKVSLPRSFLEKLYQLHLTWLFWIVNIILFIPFSTGSIRNQASNIGLSGKNTSTIIINGSSLLLNNIIGVILALFCTEPFKGKREYATYTPLPKTILFLSKAAFAPLVIFLDKNNHGEGAILNVLGLIISLIQLLILIQLMPYYSPHAMKAALSWNFIGIWVLIVNIILIIFAASSDVSDLNGVGYFKMLMIPFCIKLAILTFNQLVKSYLATNMDSLRSEELVFKKLLSFTLLIENLNISMNIDSKLNEYEAYFFGDLADHSRTCLDSDCICRIPPAELPKDLGDIKNKKQMLQIYKEKRAGEILRVGIKRVKENNKLKLAYAHMLLEGENTCLGPAMAHIYAISKNSNDIFQLSMHSKKCLLLKAVEEKLDQLFNSKNDGILNLKVFIDFHEAQTRFKSLILSNTQKFQDFWFYYRVPNFKMISLYNKSQTLEIESEQIEKMWNFYINKYSHFYSLMGEYYCIYQSLVRNLPYYATKTSKKYSWKLRGLNFGAKKQPFITEANLILPDTVTFYVSMEKENMGKIRYASSNVEYVLGYPSQALIGENINVLMSPSLAKEHDKILNQQIKRTKTINKNYYNISSYAKNKKGYYLPATVYVTIFPYVQKELTYLGILRVNETLHEHIVLNENGFVDGCTEKVGVLLKLSLKKNLHISDICPDISLDVGRKSGKLSSLTPEIQNDEEKKPLDSPFGKLPTLSEKFEETCQTFHFQIQKQPNHKRNENEEAQETIAYETKIIPRIILKKKFYILTLSSILNQEDISSEKSIDKKKMTFPLNFENDSEIPNEIQDTLQGPLKSHDNHAPLSLDYLSTFPNLRPSIETQNLETEAALLSSTNRNKKLFTESLFTPKTEISSGLIPQKEQPSSPMNEKFETGSNSNFMKKVKSTENTPKAALLKQTTNAFNDPSHSNDSLEVEDEDHLGIQASEKASSVSSNSGSQKIERVVYAMPHNKVTRVACYMMVFFFILSLGFLTTFVLYGEKLLDKVQKNVLIIKFSGIILNEILFVNRYAELITLVREGLVQNDRFSKVFFRPMEKSLPSNMLSDANYLRYLNNKVRLALTQTDSELLNEVYRWKIPITLEDSKPNEKNLFDSITDLVMRAFIVRSTPTIFTEEDPNVNYILNNTMNHLLVKTEGLNKIFIQDNEFKLNALKEFSIISLLAIFVLGSFLIALLGCQQIKFIKGRNDFFEVFLRLNETEITLALKRVKAFIAILTRSDPNLEKIKSFNTIIPNRNFLYVQNSSHQRIKKRESNMKNINKNQFTIFVLGLILFIVFLLPFLHVSFEVQITTSEISTNLLSFTKINYGLYHILLLSGSFYQYVRTKGDSYMRNNKIEIEWENLRDEISRSQDYLVKLLIQYQNEKMCTDSIRANVAQLIEGDLCKAESLSDYAYLCKYFPESLLSKGLQNLNSFSLFTLSPLKSQFDNSAMTFEDKSLILSQSDLIDLDLMIATFQSYGYLNLQEYLESCAGDSIIRIQQGLRAILISYFVIFAIVIPLIIYFLLKKIEREKAGWRKIFRKIPLEIFVTNKMLKHHLIKGSNLPIKI